MKLKNPSCATGIFIYNFPLCFKRVYLSLCCTSTAPDGWYINPLEPIS